MSVKTLALTALAALTLVGCTSISPSSQIPAVDMSFRSMPVLNLDVNTINVADTSSGAALQTGGYGIKVIPPKQAFENYVRARLMARGQAGFLNLDIQQAALTAKSQTPSGRWTEKFTVGTPTEYTLNLRVGAVLTGTGRPDVKSAYTLERKVTVPANATIAQREHDVNTLIADTIIDMDTALTNGLRDSMRIVMDGGYAVAPAHTNPYGAGAPTPLR